MRDAICYQTKGELTLDRVSDPFELIFAGSTSRVVLHRATVTEDGHSVLEQDGDCVSITGVPFDTAPSPGRECLSAEDCGNPLLEVCDPSTNTCAPPQCGEFESCPNEGQVCVSQYGDVFFGDCYQSCDPSATSVSQCSTEQRCVQFGLDPTFGLCKYVGAGELGTNCETTDNGTSCVGDAICSLETLTCSPSCRYFDATNDCPSGGACSLFGVCVPTSIGSPSVIGAPCGPTDELAAGCGSDGESFRGICFAYPPEPLVCEKACLEHRIAWEAPIPTVLGASARRAAFGRPCGLLGHRGRPCSLRSATTTSADPSPESALPKRFGALGDLGCGTGEFCALRFSSGLGVCRPQPVCGDGVLGEIDRVRDDGSSSDCRTVEYSPRRPSSPSRSGARARIPARS